MSKKPNILLIMADQLAPQFTGAYGHGVVKTPNIDRLASQGARFDAAYCNSPLCAPSRFSFMAGQHITNIGAYDNASEFPATIPTFAHYLRSGGYRTCLSGKMHFVGPDQLHGFEERITTDVYPSDHAWTPDWENPDERISKWYHNMESVQEAGEGVTTFQIEYDEEVAFAARRRLFEYAMEKTEPFCMVVSFIHPHDPYVARPEWWNLYTDDEIDLPKISADSLAEKDPHTKRVMKGIEADVVKCTEQEIRNARRGYYANTSYFDDKVGAMVQALKEAELLDNTIVIVTSDHGDMLGERGLWYKMCFFEHSVRVPLIMTGPKIPQGVIESPCSLVDLLPTMLDIAGLDGVKDFDGRSLLPVAMGKADSGNEAIAEYCAECASHPIYMIRRGEFKYVYCAIDPPQLYNLKSDPDELDNLAENPDYADIAAAFSKEVAERWDSDAIRSKVIKSQHKRRTVHHAMQEGQLTSWDYQPVRDASNEYVRNHMDWTVAAERTRFPPFDKKS